MNSFSTTPPMQIRREINRGIQQARTQRSLKRVEAAIRAVPDKSVGYLRAKRLEEFETEYETHTLGYFVLGMVCGASILTIILGLVVL